MNVFYSQVPSIRLKAPHFVLSYSDLKGLQAPFLAPSFLLSVRHEDSCNYRKLEVRLH